MSDFAEHLAWEFYDYGLTVEAMLSRGTRGCKANYGHEVGNLLRAVAVVPALLLCLAMSTVDYLLRSRG